VSQEVVKRINKQYPLNAGHSIELQSVNGRPSIRSLMFLPYLPSSTSSVAW